MKLEICVGLADIFPLCRDREMLDTEFYYMPHEMTNEQKAKGERYVRDFIDMYTVALKKKRELEIERGQLLTLRGVKEFEEQFNRTEGNIRAIERFISDFSIPAGQVAEHIGLTPACYARYSLGDGVGLVFPAPESRREKILGGIDCFVNDFS